MKHGQNLRDLQANKKKENDERWIHQPVCMVCNKTIEGYYAHFGEQGTCSKTCMQVQDKVDKYPGHDEASFLKKFNL